VLKDTLPIFQYTHQSKSVTSLNVNTVLNDAHNVGVAISSEASLATMPTPTL